MDPTIQSETAECLRQARRLGTALGAASDKIEKNGTIDEINLSMLHDARMFRMLLPKECDGDEVAPFDYLLVIEEMARHDASVAWNVFVGNSAALIAPFLPEEVARIIFLDPRAIVAWGPPHDGKAKAELGGYRISGTWDFASGCRQASWMGIHCQVLEKDGNLRLNPSGQATMRSLLFPRDQAILYENWDAIGLRGTASDSYSVEDLFVPEAYTTTREDPSLRRKSGPLYAFPMQGLYAVGVAGVALGIARGMLSAFIDLAIKKTPRGLHQLANTPTIQIGVGQSEAKLGAARAYLLEALREVYKSAGEILPIDIADRARIRLAATHAIHSAIDIVDWVYKEAGVSAIFPGSPFERRFRDMHTLSQQIQSRGSHYQGAGNVLMGARPSNYL